MSPKVLSACLLLPATAVVVGLTASGSPEPQQEPSVEQLVHRLIDASTDRFGVERVLPEVLRRIEEERGAKIDAQAWALIDRWFSGARLYDLLTPLYLRHLAPETIEAAVEFYATEPGAAFTRKSVGLWEPTPPNPTGEPTAEGEELARHLVVLRRLDLRIDLESLDLESLAELYFPGLSEEEYVELVAQVRERGVYGAWRRNLALTFTVEELRAALDFYRSPPGVALRRGQAEVLGDLGLAVYLRAGGLVLPGSLLSPLAVEEYWPRRKYTEVMSFFGRPSFAVPTKGTAMLCYALDDQRAEELKESSRVVDPTSFADFDPRADEEWLALDAEFRRKYPDLDGIPSPGHIWLANFVLDETGRVESARLVQAHEGVRQYLALTRRMLELRRREVELNRQLDPQ